MYKKRGINFFLNKFLNVIFLVGLSGALLSGCEKSQDSDAASVQKTVQSKPTAPELAEAAQPHKTPLTLSNASLPNLFKDENGLVWMSYVSQSDDLTSLWLTHWHGDDWATPELVAQGENWFVNWADFPSVVKHADRFVAHWLQKNGSGTYAYGVQYATKEGAGEWRSQGLLHDDDSPTEHGFVTLNPDKQGTHAVWLDGRNMQADSGHDSHVSPASDEAFDINSVTGMTLRYGLIAADGTLSERQELDALTCDCCQTTSGLTQNGLVVAYRDRVAQNAKSEIRDIKILRQTDSGWVAAENSPEDNWDIQACPVNGPMLAAQNNDLALAWFTAADQKAKVQVVFSDNNGESFAPAIAVDVENNLGRVGTDWVDANTIVVVWIGMRDAQAHLLSRLIHKNAEMQGEMGDKMEDTQSIALMDMSRGSGVPQVATLSGGEILYAWTQTGDTPSIHTVHTIPNE